MNLWRFIGYQLLPVLFGGGLAVVIPWTQKVTWEERLARVDDNALEQVQASLKEIIPARAFFERDLHNFESFLALLVEVTDHEWVNGRVSTHLSSDGLIPSDYRLTVVGDPYDLPVLLEGVHRFRSLLTIQGLSIEPIGDGKVTSEITMTLIRPDIPPENWIDDLDVSSPDQVQLLKEGWNLWNWRAYLQRERELMELATSYRLELHHSLAHRLIDLRTGGPGLKWTPEQGIFSDG